MYLGQLAKLREAFASSRVTVTLDGRDQQALLDREGDRDATRENDPVAVQDVQRPRQVRSPPVLWSNTLTSIQVLLRTVDNYQGTLNDHHNRPGSHLMPGEEADIVVLSLVRNVKEDGEEGGIGFLKVNQKILAYVPSNS